MMYAFGQVLWYHSIAGRVEVYYEYTDSITLDLRKILNLTLRAVLIKKIFILIVKKFCMVFE